MNINLHEQNWKNLFGDFTTEERAWHGTWTSYTPEKQVIRSYQGVRRFRANEDKTVIYQTNNYTYADGSKEEKNWQIEKLIANQPDGIVHSAIPSMRALSFGEGATAWLSQELEVGKNFGMELFFRYQDWRTSVSSIYGENGDLIRITQIREYLGSFPSQPENSELENIAGYWLGKQQFMTPDLKISTVSEIPQLILDPTQGKNQIIWLSDRIILNVPRKVILGEEFVIVVGKLVAENMFKRLAVNYDESGKFTMLISEVFNQL
jgi:Domain of unknown function (DUF3598)